MAQDTTCGIVWDEPIVLSDTAFDAYSPEIALSGDDTVHVVWMNGSLTIRLPYMRSTNGGMSFEPRRELLTDSVKFLGRANRPSIVANGSKVYVFFKGATFQGTYTPVRMIKSVDGGSGWASPVDISPDSTGPPPQSPAVQGDTLAIVYQPLGQPLHRILRSSNGGLTWSKTVDNIDIFPGVAFSATSLHLVEHGWSNPAVEIRYRMSTDLGDTWAVDTIISTIDGYYSDIPSIASDGDSMVMVAWRDTKYGNYGVFGASIISRIGVTGSNFTDWQPELLLTDLPRGNSPLVSIRKERWCVAWTDEIVADDTYHVVTRSSTLGMNQMCPPEDHTPDAAVSAAYGVIISKKAIHVAWYQYLDSAKRRLGVLYRRGVFVTTGIKEESLVPDSYTLSQNYPNPFNPRTTITFSLPATARVTIRIYDVFGREVSVVLRDERKEPGMHQVQWNAEGFASGVYFYKLDVRSRDGTEFTGSRKALLLK